MPGSSSSFYQCSETAGTMLDAFLSGTTILIKMPTNSNGYGGAMHVLGVSYRESQEETYFNFVTNYWMFSADSRNDYPTGNVNSGGIK